MEEQPLPPEAALDLHIGLDELRKMEERCREGLRALASGRLSRADYLEILRQQALAHRDWRRRHRSYFAEL